MTMYDRPFAKDAGRPGAYVFLHDGAEGWRPTATGMFAADRLLHSREILFYDPELEVAAGRLVDGSAADPGAHPFDEFLLVEEGELRIGTPCGTTMLAAGQAAVVPRGLVCRIESSGSSRTVFMIAAQTARSWPAPRDVFAIDLDGPLAPAGSMTGDGLLTTPPPRVARRIDYADPEGRFCAGVWQASAYRRGPVDAIRHELVKVVEGEVAIAAPAIGLERRHTAGDVFLTGRGASYAAGTDTGVRKVFCCFGPVV
jgi:uncharacterized cupin superfamily protein